jgi:frataxin-like iron-binding protein CyaY
MSDDFSKKASDVKDKANAAKDKVHEKIKGLAFRGMLEKKVSHETRAKFPVLDKLIPFTNYIACGLVVVVLVLVVVVAASSNKDNPLVGQWEYWSGDVVWFFGKSSSIVFLSDGTVIERDGGDSGKWTVIGGERLKVNEDDDVFDFTYRIQDNMLTIVDSDGDKIVYERRTGNRSNEVTTSSRTSGTATSSQSSNSSNNATSQSSTRLSGTYSMIFGSAGLLYYTFDTNGTYVYGTEYAGAVRTGTYTVEGNTVTLSGGETFTIVNSTTIRGEGSGRLYTK